MRFVMVRLLPLPAPAKMSSGPFVWATASAWGWFSSSMGSAAVSRESGFSASTPHPQAASSDDARAGAAVPDRAEAWGSGASPQVLRVPAAESFLAPSACACCLGVAAQSLVVRGSAGEAVSVNYCEECLRHASAARTRSLSVCIASVVLGVTVALATPVVLPSVSAGWLVLAALGLASLPIGLGIVWRR